MIVKKTFITSLGMIATFNGGLTNSAIKRVGLLSVYYSEYDFQYIITYCSGIEPTEKINDFFRRKYNLSNNVVFINFFDYQFDNSIGSVKPFYKDEKLLSFYVDKVQLEYSLYIKHCLDYVISNNSSDIIYLFLDVPLVPDYRINIVDNRVRPIFLLHSEHLKYDDYSKSHWKLSYYKARAYFQPIKSPLVDTVAFTQIHLDKILKREGSKKNYHLIPHSHETDEDIKSYNNRKKKISYIGRIDNATKNIKLMIDSYVASNIKNVPLEIYGEGPDFNYINDYINEIKKDLRFRLYRKNIVMMGKTTNPNSVFNESVLAILLSNYEGFGLSILESLINGCPVITSDVDYGPREMIKNAENGFLVRNEISDIADKINLFFEKNLFMEFHENAIKFSSKYSKNIYLNNWHKLFLKLESKKHIQNLPLITCSFSFVDDFMMFFISENPTNCHVKIRSYDLGFDDFDEFDFIETQCEINSNLLKSKYLSFVVYNEYLFEEKSILSDDKYRVTKSIPGDNNVSVKFDFIFIGK